MTRVFYGVWGNEVFDDRKQKSASIEEFSVLKNVDFFNEGNPIQAFFGDKGFLIFDKSVNLLRITSYNVCYTKLLRRAQNRP